MSNNFSLSEEQLANLRKELSGPPPRSSMSAWSMVRSMHDLLKAAREQGKTLEEMHADVVRCGVDIKLGTFRKYASDLLSDDSKPRFKASPTTVPKQPDSPSLRSLSTNKGPGL